MADTLDINTGGKAPIIKQGQTQGNKGSDPFILSQAPKPKELPVK